MLMKTLTENNVLFYDEKNYNNFLYDVSQGGGFCEETSEESSSTEAYFVCNIGVILANISKWKSCIPNVKLNYHVSANFDPSLIRILKDYGLQFSFSSASEMVDLLNLEVEPSTMIYNGHVKYTQHISDASLSDVNCLSVGTIHELERIVRCHSNPKLLLRVSTMSDKFIKFLDRCVELDVTIEGLCYQLPTVQNSSTKVDYNNCFETLASIVNYIEEKHNIQVDLINLGSKIPRYGEDEDSPFQQFARSVNQFTAKFDTINMIAEPTHFMFDGANQLCCNVMGIRHLYDESAQRTNMFYYLNDGTYGSLGDVFFRGYIPKVEILQKETFLTKDSYESPVTHFSTFWGPTCDSMDKICTVDAFPALALGDTVMFNDVGVHGLACATNFNGFNLPTSRFIVSYQKLESLGISNSSGAVKQDKVAATN